MRRNSNGTGTNGLVYLLGDHLGSASLTADPLDGDKLSELRYKAWGETRYALTSVPTDRRFTGQVEEVGIGLYFYGARFYDPALSRFTSADSIIPGAGDVQAWDRYAAMLNNPLKYIDPTGHRSDAVMHDSDGDAECNDPDHCLDATGMSKLSQTSKDVRMSRVRIGARPATQPSLTGPYSGEPIDDTCFNCSVEPRISGTAGMAGGIDLLNFVGATILNVKATNDAGEIFLYAYQAEYSNGNVAVDSLEVVNTTNMDVSVMNTTFNVSGSPYCTGTCIYPGTGSYRVAPGPSIQPPYGHYGLGTVKANSRGYISLTQPGGGNRPSNVFYPYQDVTMSVFMANTDTGKQWAPIAYPIQ